MSRKKTKEPEKKKGFQRIESSVKHEKIESPSPKKLKQVAVDLKNVVKPDKPEKVKRSEVKKVEEVKEVIEEVVEEVIAEDKPKLVKYNSFQKFYKDGANKAEMLNRKHHPYWHNLHNNIESCSKCDFNEPRPVEVFRCS